MNGGINIRVLICRTCLKMSKPLHNIFYYHKNNRLLSELLVDLASIKVQKDDRLPVNICNSCLDKLTSACDFNAMVIASDTKLHNFYCNSTGERDDDALNQLTVIKEESVLSYPKLDLWDIDSKASQNIISTRQEEMVLTLNSYSQVKHRRENLSECSETIKKHVEKTVKEEDMDEDNVALQDGCDDSSSSIDSSSDDDSLVKIEKDKVENQQILLQNNLVTAPSDKSNCAEPVKEESKEGSSSEDDADCNSPIKSLDISEYEKLKSTLTKSEKARTKLFCKLCKKSMGFNYYFKIHLPQHTGQLPYKCDICDLGFPLPSALKVHKKKHADSKPFSCELCGRCFKYKGGLQTHLILHTEEYPFKCTICEKSFRQYSNLHNHLQNHRGERGFVCDICGKAFNTRPNLRNHKLTHNTETSFVCQTCGKSYTTRKVLMHHAKTHLEVKPHVCSYCNKRFSCRGVLQKHVFIHTGEKPYSCTVCGKAFRQNSVVRNHMRIHTGETPFPCVQCPMKFKYSHHLRNHVKKVHN